MKLKCRFSCFKQWLSTQSPRQRLWRLILISGVVQLFLVLAVWHSWRVHHASNTAAVTLTSTPPAATTRPPHQSASSNQTQTPAAQPTSETAQKGAQPLATPASTPTHATDSVKPSTEQSTGSINHPNTLSTVDSMTHINAPLWSVPIPLQRLSYKARIQNDAWTQDVQTAQLSVNSLGEQRYEVILSNKQGNTHNGNIGFHSVFIASAVGPQPMYVGGGAYLKTPDMPKGFALGALKFEQATNPSEHSEANQLFLDRASLIIYIQGALIAKRIQPPQKLQLPIYGVGGVHQQMVSISSDHPSDSLSSYSCSSCVRASTSGDLGEVKQWSVWYDGTRNWQPVLMQMRLGKTSEWVLTLSLKS